MFFYSIKEINRLRKELSSLLCKGMSKNYLKVTTETFSKLRFSGFIKFASRSLFGELRLRQISLNLKLLVATKKSEVWEQDCVRFFNYFFFGRNYHVLKSYSPCILLNKNINFNKNETESKMENPTHSFRETNLVLQLI